MNDPKIKSQIVEKIRQSSNILVTVSNDPSVDELSAALGMTLLLNKMDKHATAVYSGQTPPAIQFLEPERTFENTTDSLRDFIIALDKEKADHLRYKLEGDVVKIFITPYRTSITSDDLEFSQGDYNVELVIALGVENRDHLDAALEAHGRILHDATVVTLSAGEQTSNLGSIDWRDKNASSLSEMLATLTEGFKDKKLLNKAISTAWLTGIVSTTDRFSNSLTSSRVMSIAAQLMAAGADQQLIATKLEQAGGEERPRPAKKEARFEDGEGTKIDRTEKESGAEQEAKKSDDGALVISHEKQGDADEVARQTYEEQLAASERAAQRALEKQQELEQEAQSETQEEAPARTEGGAPLDQEASSQDDPENPAIETEAKHTEEAPEPAFGGTLNATTEQAEEEKRRQIEKDKNRTILSHQYVGNRDNYKKPVNAEDEGPEVKSPFDAPATSSTPATGFEPQNQAAAKAAPIEPPKPDFTPEPPQEEQPAPTPKPISVEPPRLDFSPPKEQTPPQPVPPEQPPVPEQQPPVQEQVTEQEIVDAIAPPAPSKAPTLAEIDAENRASAHDDARAAVDAALQGGEAAPTPEQQPFRQEEPVAPFIPQPPTQTSGFQPQGPGPQPFTPSAGSQLPQGPETPDAYNGLPLPPPIPDFSQSGLPPVPETSSLPPAPQPERLGDILEEPDQGGSQLPPAPQLEQQEPAPTDPGQFRIPGQ